MPSQLGHVSPRCTFGVMVSVVRQGVTVRLQPMAPWGLTERRRETCDDWIDRIGVGVRPVEPVVARCVGGHARSGGSDEATDSCRVHPPIDLFVQTAGPFAKLPGILCDLLLAFSTQRFVSLRLDPAEASLLGDHGELFELIHHMTEAVLDLPTDPIGDQRRPGGDVAAAQHEATGGLVVPVRRRVEPSGLPRLLPGGQHVRNPPRFFEHGDFCMVPVDADPEPARAAMPATGLDGVTATLRLECEGMENPHGS